MEPTSLAIRAGRARRSPGNSAAGRALLALTVVMSLCACGQTEIDRNDPRLRRENGVLFYEARAFSGVLIATHRSKGRERVASRTEYRDGRKHGFERVYHRDGQLLSERGYVAGRKEGTHRGWHANGQVRFYMRFRDDTFAGENFAWFPNGQTAYYARYAESDGNGPGGGRLLGLKQWRPDGKVFMNYVPRGNERYGLYGGKLCKRVRGNQNGDTISY